ncbi:hypothetical protein ACHAXT_006387 [Thalassiosira profunda]
MSGNEENEDPAPRRSGRGHTQRVVDTCGNVVYEEADGRTASKTTSPPILAKPQLTQRRDWHNKSLGDFSSADGDRIVDRWGGRSALSWAASGILAKGEKALIDEQGQEVVLEMTKFGSYGPKLTQVPFHEGMLPAWDYFAQGIHQASRCESLKITNFHLPQSPWLGETLLPALATHNSGYDFDENLTALSLTNCSLPDSGLKSLAKYLQKNKTLRRLTLSRNVIESVATVRALAKAIKSNPSLLHVSLAHCNLGGGSHKALKAILAACKGCASLDIGHHSFDAEAVSQIVQWLGQDIALTSFSLVGAHIDKDNKKILESSLVANETITKLSLRSNGLRLPGFRSIKKTNQSLSRLTTLDLSENSLPTTGVRALAKFLTKSNTSLTTLVLSGNNLTSKGCALLLPAVKEVTSLVTLDLSKNWLNDKVSPAVINLLDGNETLRTLDLSGNNSLKAHYGGYRRWWQRGPIPEKRDGGKALIVKNALFDTTSLNSIANSNHTCAVRFTGQKGDVHDETIRKINELKNEGQKIRLKVVLALADVNKSLFDPGSFSNLPLELMPRLLHLIQLELGVNGCGKVLGWKAGRKDRSKREWDRDTYDYTDIPDPTLSQIYQVITAWQSLPLLFVNGAGELPKKKKVVKETKSKKKKARKRRRFGDEDDVDDEPYIPTGARKTPKWVYDQDAGRSIRIPPPVY